MHKLKNFRGLVMTGMFVLTGCITALLLGTSLFFGNRMTATYAPLADAAMEIKLEATTAHLWFEEILIGDNNESIDKVREHLDTAIWYSSAMLEGGRNAEGQYSPLTDQRMRWEIKQVKRKLKRLQQVTEERFKNRETSSAGTEIDQVFDRIFDDLLAQADSVETQLQLLMKNELEFFINLTLGLILLVVISVIFLSFLFYRYHSQQENHQQELATVNRRMNLVLDNLEEKVSERTHELSKANERLQELERLKSMFIASVSHELRTPLNTIIGFSGMILQGLTGELNREQHDYLRRIEKSGKHLLSLISDVIDISRIEAGKLTAIPSSFMLHEMLNEAVDDCRLELEQKGLTLHAAVADNLEVHTDRRRLYQCVLNLLSNAIKYSDTGEVRLSTRLDGPNIEIAVEDDGIGIDRLDMPRLFQPFERISLGDGKSISGTGLGLYLTKKLISELLMGNISVESQVGVGSRFSIRIPTQLENHG